MATMPSGHSTKARVAPVDLAAIGRHVTRNGLVLVLLWVGGMKFTTYEAQGIKEFVANSPLLSWTYTLLSVQGVSSLIGVAEIVIGLLIAARVFSARLAALGGRWRWACS